MKITKIRYVAITAFALASLLMGCSEEVYEGAYKPSLESHYLSVYPRDFEFGNGEDTKTGSITSENAWSFSSIPSWLSLTPSSGNSDADFSIVSKTNESVSNREAVFYVSTNNTASKIQRTLTASQTGSSPYITFPEYSSSTITLEGKSDYLIIDVNSNIPDLTATFSQSWASAIYNSEAKTVNVEIQANETNSSRSGTLTVSSSQYSKTAKLTISQLASGVTILEGIAMSYDADGGSQTRTIKSDLPWTAQTTYPWIEFSPKSGHAGETTMTITTLPSYESDKRIGQIYFYFGNTEKKYIGITQNGRYINVTPTSISLDAQDKTAKEVEVETNIDWKVLYCPEWLSISPQSGTSGKSKLNISATDNRSLNSRSSTVALSDATEGIQTTVNVVQSGLNFGDNTVMEFSWKNSKQSLSVPIPNNWVAAVSEDWIKLSQYEGFGTTDIIVNVDQNDNEASRQGILSFTSEGKTISITVYQLGQYLQIDKTSGEFSAMGGSLDLTVSTSVDISASIEYTGNTKDWISLKSNDNGSYVITADYNPTTSLRDANIVILPNEDEVSDKIVQGLKFAIKQQGRNISADVSKIIMYSKGGTSNTYSISSDGKYLIEKGTEDYWYSLVSDKSNNTFYIVVTKNTTGTERIGHIRLYLTDLPANDSGKTVIIAVEQYDSDYSINIDDYDDDEILD